MIERAARVALAIIFIGNAPGTVRADVESITPIDAGEFSALIDANRGDVVLVNFWATWCRPCLEEIPDLMALDAELSDRGFELMAISLDEPSGLDTMILPFMARWFPEFTSFLSVEIDRDRMVSVIDPAWNEVLPTSYVLSRDGTVVTRIQGGSSRAEFAAAIEPHL